MLLFVVRCLCCARARVCVIHWHCSAQLSMFNMEKRYRNKIIIIIIIITCYLFPSFLFCVVHATGYKDYEKLICIKQT